MKKKPLAFIPPLLAAFLLAFGLSGCVGFTFDGSDGAPVTADNTPKETYQFIGGALAADPLSADTTVTNTDTSAADAFTRVAVSVECNINYHYADTASATFTVSPNLKQYFDVFIKDGTFTVKSTRTIVNFNDANTPVLDVYAPTLTGLNVSGASKLKTYDPIGADSFDINVSGAVSGSAEINVSALTVNISGAGALTLSGTASTSSVNVSGAGSIDALSLQTSDTVATLSGVGSVKVNCSNSLTYNVSGVGGLKYSGNPATVTGHTSGIGGVSKID